MIDAGSPSHSEQQSQRLAAEMDHWLVLFDEEMALDEVPLGKRPMRALNMLFHYDAIEMRAGDERLDGSDIATLACAHRLGACALIDERKATQIAAKRFEALEVLSTVDLLLSPEVRSACGADLGDVLFGALTGARMRVPDHYAEEIVRVVGVERAMSCHSLPARVRRPVG